MQELSKEELIEEILRLESTVKNQSEEISVLRRYLYARKNEKWTEEDKVQSQTFDEAETTCQEESLAVKDQESNPQKPKKKPGRKPLPDDIPRYIDEIDIEDDQKLCPCCGKLRPLIGTTMAEKLDFEMAKMTVRQYQKKRYGACDCEEFQSNEDLPQVIEAKVPDLFIPGGIATPSLVAHIIVGKFCDALPLYRQERIFDRIGVSISRQNMSNWSLTASGKCDEILKYMKTVAKKGTLINMDETVVQVLNEKDRTAENKSYMWVMTGGFEGRKVVLFNYSPTRNQNVPLTQLEGYHHILQTDGYAGYNKAVKEYGLWHVGCLTHARRKFYTLAQVTKKKGKAHQGVQFFTDLYKIESQLKTEGLSPEEYLRRRREQAIPIWQKFHKWLIKMKKILGEGKLLDAVNYSLNQYKNLVRYLKYPEITPDNNVAENAIRPFCVGRKNWLFNNTPRGAHSSAALYSLVETAKINNVDPYQYLTYIFSNAQNITPETDLEALMPWNMPV